MHAVICPTPGQDLSSLTLGDWPLPEPGAGEVRVAVRAASLNPVDWKLCTGFASWWDSPHVPGVDAAGVVEALGPGVTAFAVGDRVAWHHDLRRETGTFADITTTSAHVLARIPEGVSFAAAAALPCAGMTAYQALVRKCRIEAGQVVLVQGASGGTGGFAVQIAKSVGCEVIALARPQHADRVRALGADHVLDYRAGDLAAQVRAIAPDGVDVMFEVLKAENVAQNFVHIRFNGQFVTTDPLPDMSNVPAYTYALSIHEVALGGAYGAGDLRTQRDFAVMLEALLAQVARGEIDPMITETIGMEDIPNALQRLRDRAVDGKIVAVLPEEAQP